MIKTQPWQLIGANDQIIEGNADLPANWGVGRHEHDFELRAFDGRVGFDEN